MTLDQCIGIPRSSCREYGRRPLIRLAQVDIFYSVGAERAQAVEDARVDTVEALTCVADDEVLTHREIIRCVRTYVTAPLG